MGRGGGGGGGGGGGYRGGGGRPAPRRVARSAPPQKAKPAPPPSVAATPVSNGSFLGNLGSAIVEGFGFGTGSGIAHRAVDGLFGPRTINVHETTNGPHPVVAPNSATTMGGSDACTVHSKAFQDCLNGYGSDISKCQYYMDMLAECKRNSGGSVMS